MIKDSTLPKSDNFSFIDLPDGDGRNGWPPNSFEIDTQAPAASVNVKVDAT